MEFSQSLDLGRSALFLIENQGDVAINDEKGKRVFEEFSLHGSSPKLNSNFSVISLRRSVSAPKLFSQNGEWGICSNSFLSDMTLNFHGVSSDNAFVNTSTLENDIKDTFANQDYTRHWRCSKDSTNVIQLNRKSSQHSLDPHGRTSVIIENENLNSLDETSFLHPEYAKKIESQLANFTIKTCHELKCIAPLDLGTPIKIPSNSFQSSIADTSKTSNSILDFKGLKDMSAWNLPKEIVVQYRKQGITTMFDWQVECLSNAQVLFEHKNLVYSAPTSAGKSLVAEILMLKTLIERKQRVFVILPFVSVVREKMLYFQSILDSSGYRAEGFFGGYTPPGGLESIHVAICTIEKANSIINKALEQSTLDQIGAIVIDEVHLVSEPGRGYILELLIAKILYIRQKYGFQIQVIAMSATLSNMDLLGQWLDAEVFVTDFRPVALREMIKIGTQLFDRDFNTIKDIKNGVMEMGEPFPNLQNDPENIAQLSIETLMIECSVIIFCPSKEWCENLAVQLSTAIKFLINSSLGVGSEIQKQLNKESLIHVKEQLKNLPTGLDSALEKIIPYGCAFHHAGLTIEERDIIEDSFRKGILKIIVATSTLSSGVNLPARRVIIRSPLFAGKKMSSITYQQMIGRAGRTGRDTLGESILIASENNIRLVKELICSGTEPVSSCLILDNSAHLKRALLEVISAGVVHTEVDIDVFLNCTLLKAQKTSEADKNALTENIKEVLNFLVNYEFIRLQKNDITEEPTFVATRLGMACLASSVPPADGLILLAELRKARQCFVLENELHAVYLVTPYSVCSQVSEIDWLLFLELWENLSPSMKKVGELVGVRESFLVRAMRGSGKLNYQLIQIHKRFYISLALQELVNESPINKVSAKFKCSKGLLQSLQQLSSTFAGIVTAFCHALKWSSLALLVSQFKERLYFGVHHDLIDLMRINDLTQSGARTLFDSGITDLVRLAHSNTFDIEKILYNSLSFDTHRPQEQDIYSEAKRSRKDFFIRGKFGLTIKETAELLLQQARCILQYELGANKINWTQTENVYDEALNKNTFISVNENQSSTKIQELGRTGTQCYTDFCGTDDENTLVDLKLLYPKNSLKNTNIFPNDFKCQQFSPKLSQDFLIPLNPVVQANQFETQKSKEAKYTEIEGLEDTVDFIDKYTETQHVEESIKSVTKTNDGQDFTEEVQHTLVSKLYRENEDNMQMVKLFSINTQQIADIYDVSKETDFKILANTTSKIKKEQILNTEDLFTDSIDESYNGDTEELIKLPQDEGIQQEKTSPYRSPDFHCVKCTIDQTSESHQSSKLTEGIISTTLDSKINSSETLYNTDEIDINSINFSALDLSIENSLIRNPYFLNSSHILSCSEIDDEPSSLTCINIVDICGNEKIFAEAFKDILSAKRVGLSVGLQNRGNKVTPTIGSKLFLNPVLMKERETSKSFEINASAFLGGISFCTSGNIVYFLNMQQENCCETITLEKKCEHLRMLFHKRSKTVEMFDCKEQLKVLWFLKLLPKSIKNEIEDPKIANWVLQPDKHLNIREMAQQFAPECSALLNICGNGRTSGSCGLDFQSAIVAKIRCSVESCVTIHVLNGQRENLGRIGNGQLLKFFKEVEMPLQISLCIMETHGFPVNQEAFQNLVEKMSNTLRKLEENIYKTHGSRFNIGASSVVAKILGLKKQPNGRVNTNKQVLEKLDTPICKMIMNYRKLNAILSKNMLPLLKCVQDNRIHGQSSTVTATGRISMTEPNLQNVAKDFYINLGGDEVLISCRMPFFPNNPEIVLISSDFCQLEMRILAHLSQDTTLLMILRSKQDIFKAIAARWNNIAENDISEDLRNATKQICYGVIYGMGMKSLSDALKCTEQEAKVLSDQFHATYPGIRLFAEKVLKFAKKNGYVETITGRRRYLEHINSCDTQLKNQAERQAINSTIQGSAADIVKSAILRIEKNFVKYREKLGLQSSSVHLVLHLHDELIFEVPTEKAKKIAKILSVTMENCVKLSVPLKVKLRIGSSWGELKELHL